MKADQLFSRIQLRNFKCEIIRITSIPETNTTHSGSVNPLTFLKIAGGHNFVIFSEQLISHAGKAMNRVAAAMS